jgi:Fe2+ or Zn2+ uptake regulation protein
MSTVYYTLNLFKTQKLVKELEFYDMDNRYEANTANHLNLICVECGKIQDFREGLPVSSKKIEEQTGFRALDMRLEYYGYCSDCSRKKS